MSKFIRVADKAAMLAKLVELKAAGFSFDAIAVKDVSEIARVPCVIAYKEAESVTVLFNAMAEGVSFMGKRAAVQAREMALSLIAEAVEPAAATEAATVTNRIARVKAEMRELAEYEAAIEAKPAAAEVVEPAAAQSEELKRAPYATKAEAVAAIQAAGFELENNDSGNGDKFETVTAGEFPGMYNHYARPVYDPTAGHWVILIDVNRFADLPAVAEEMAAAAQSMTAEDALREIGELLNDWPTMRALSASGAEKATANKKRARELVAAALKPEAKPAVAFTDLDSVIQAMHGEFSRLGNVPERIMSESKRSGSRLDVINRANSVYWRASKASRKFGYIGVGCISFAEARLRVFSRRVSRLLSPNG